LTFTGTTAQIAPIDAFCAQGNVILQLDQSQQAGRYLRKWSESRAHLLGAH
jgi:cysteine sulfinate desulfinase/cysteine desulfurase-like protein